MNVTLAALQMVSGPDVAGNLLEADALIGAAAAAGAEIVVLPEYFCHMGLHPRDKLDHMEEPPPAPGTPDASGFQPGPVQRFLSEAARRHGVTLVGGTLPLRSPRLGRVLNSTLVYGPDGALRARYDKIHLFGFHRGDEHFDEADTIVPGRTPVVCDVPTRAGPTLRLGLSICYDLRFPELYRRLAPVDVIVAPSAFTYTTGQAHWELLVRTRAVENQCSLIAAAQGGTHPGGRRTWGHACVVDPWGVVQHECPEGAGLAIGTWAHERQQEVRTALPALRHRVL